MDFTFAVEICLRDDGEGYANVTSAAGELASIEVTVRAFTGLIHGGCDLGNAILNAAMDEIPNAAQEAH